MVDKLIRKRQYAFMGLPLMLVLMLGFFLNASLGVGIYFFLGHVWVLTMTVPGLEDKTSHRRYKYSTLKLTYRIDRGLRELWEHVCPGYKEMLARLSVVTVFTLVLTVLVGIAGLACLAGGLLSEGLYFLFKEREVRRRIFEL